jgi:response regulator RpfG family c-di-GMP phosphodiesterase/HAMP domain-containing protein
MLMSNKFRSIKVQIVFVLAVQLAVLLGVVSTTLYLLDLRKHDYLILNLSSQLRLLIQGITKQSTNYVKHAPRSYEAYERDLGLFHQDLKTYINSFDHIIQSFEKREIPPELVNAEISGVIRNTAQIDNKAKVPSLLYIAEPLYCTWDKPSRNQLAQTAFVWKTFKQGLLEELGSNQNEPRLEAAANYIILNELEMSLAGAELSAAFRNMMEQKLEQISLLNKVAIIFMILISFTLILILYYKIFNPIDKTVSGFKRVTNGDLGFRVPVQQKNEIGHMTEAFNVLTRRLSSLFTITDTINQATTLDETIKVVYEMFPEFLPLDWVGLVRTSNSKHFLLEHYYNHNNKTYETQTRYNLSGSMIEYAINTGKPICTGMPEFSDNEQSNEPFLQTLRKEGMRSFFLMPLMGNYKEKIVLVFSSTREGAYNPNHIEFLENIASQVGHSFEKTYGMENLVVSTIEGLAKLAESRDPETGDHLYRMSRYSAIITDALMKHENYKDIITQAFVRDVFRFAPMHDIGKVGIEDRILLKPGRLTDEERSTMETHPKIGGDVLRRCESQVNEAGRSIFTIGIEIAEGHHEKYNGSGYPNGIKGKAIPLSARIVAVADVFDALTSKRPYKEAWSIERAMKLMRDESGQHFDPDVIDAMENAMPNILEIYNKHKHV